MLIRIRERGDTLIEVIFATAVLALIIVLALTIMTRGTAQAQRAVEGTFVRQSIDSQSEMLRYARDAYVNKSGTDAEALWNNILLERVGSAPAFSELARLSDCKPPFGQKAFYLGLDTGKVAVKSSFTTPQVFATPGNGLWIEATSGGGTGDYVDFYIYACWDSPAGATKSTTGTIVRLYAPTV